MLTAGTKSTKSINHSTISPLSILSINRSTSPSQNPSVSTAIEVQEMHSDLINGQSIPCHMDQKPLKTQQESREETNIKEIKSTIPPEQQWIFIEAPNRWSNYLPHGWTPAGPLIPAIQLLLKSPTLPMWALPEGVTEVWSNIQQAHTLMHFAALKEEDFQSASYVTEDQIKTC